MPAYLPRAYRTLTRIFDFLPLSGGRRILTILAFLPLSGGWGVALAIDTLQVTTPDPVLEQWRWTEFDRTSGLAEVVRDITQDRGGNIWFATQHGVQRYDGHRWTTYTTEEGLAHNEVRTVMQAQDGAMWFGTANGISRFDPSLPEQEAWTTYTTADGLPYNSVETASTLSGSALIQARDGTIWVSLREPKVGTAICRFDPSPRHRSGQAPESGQAVWRSIDLPETSTHRTSIYEASDHTFWVLHGFDIFQFDGTNWTQHTPPNGSGVSIPTGILESSPGVFWVSFLRGGIGQLNTSDDSDSRWRIYTNQDSLEEVVYRSIFQTQDGAIWATGDRGLSRFEAGQWKVYSQEELPHLEGRMIVGKTLPDGTIWFQNKAEAQVFRFDPSNTRWTVYSHLPNTPVLGGAEAGTDYLFAMGDIVWFPTQDGVVRYDGKTWTRYTAADGLINGLVSTVLKGKDSSLWVAGQHKGKSGAARFDGKTWQIFSQADGMVGENIYAGYVAQNGDLWLGTKSGLGRGVSHGVMCYNGENWTVYSTEEGLPHNTIYSISQTSDGAIWIGTLDGLSRFDPSAGSDVWTTFTEEKELNGRKIRTLCPTPNGDLWTGYGYTGRGASRYDGTNWTHYLEENGPDGNAVMEITRSRDGTLWFGTDTGTSRYDGTSWTHYTRNEIPISFANFRTIAETSDGAIWIGGGGEALRLMPDRDPPETSLKMSIDRVSSVGNILLKWSGHDAWNSTRAINLRYQHHLNNGPWSDWSGETDHTFMGLSSGNHTFGVRTADQDGNIDPTPAVHTFLVEAPWWKNPYVLGGSILLLGLVSLQTGRVIRRDRRLRAANQKLDESNQELTVEAALERVRAKAQGMQESEDLHNVSATLSETFEDLGFSMFRFSIYILDEEADTVESFPTHKDKDYEKGRFTKASFREWVETLVQAQESMEARKQDHPHFVFEVAGEDRVAFFRNVKSVYKHSKPGWLENSLRTLPDPMIEHEVFFPHGFLGFNGAVSFSEADLAVASRFAGVFDFAYTRFLELQEKEARNRELEATNRAMSEANKELFQANLALQRDSAVERIRGEVQAMEQTSDFEQVLSLLSEDLKAVGLSFDTCEIDVLDEPVDELTMPYFVERGFRYTTYAIQPDGTVTSESYHNPAPFPTVIRETLERFIEGEPWQGRSGQNAIVEVPASNYGRLRITSSERQDFTKEDIDSLQDFASAIALGYARYLDIREIQEQTQRKSAFLASMSHELRTPMNAIKGFTNLVLRREKDLSDRNRENLEKVTQASDHLLAMINDILDLSKIEAGRMDVNPEPFDMKTLVTYCCATVSPLLEEKPDVNLEQDVADGIEQANTDQGRIRQMLINLLSNAIKFTDSGSVTVRAKQDDGLLVLSVSDTGQGIPDEEVLTIFDEYRQVKGSDKGRKGTGLGLSITKQFAELLGGSIGVESQAGKGSTFTVRVPVVYKEA